MRLFFDTSTLIASFHEQNARHTACFEKLRSVSTGKNLGFVASHSLAEIYSVLTRLPSGLRLSSQHCLELISENILKYFKISSLNENEYIEVLQQLASANLGGGIIYDALILKSAEKIDCDEFLTLNAKHFRQIPATISGKIIEL